MLTIDKCIATIPEPETLARRGRALALLDKLAGTRYPEFTFNRLPTGYVFTVEDGGGNRLDAVFADAGCFVVGFDHESPISPYDADSIHPGLFAGFPKELTEILSALAPEDGDTFPAAELDGQMLPAVTFAAWWDAAASCWKHGNAEYPSGGALDSDGSSFLLGKVVPIRFVEELNWDEALVSAVFSEGQWNEALAKRLNPDVAWADLSEFAKGIGLP